HRRSPTCSGTAGPWTTSRSGAAGRRRGAFSRSSPLPSLWELIHALEQRAPLGSKDARGARVRRKAELGARQDVAPGALGGGGQRPRGGAPALAHGDRGEHVLAPHEGTDVAAGGNRRVGAGERVGAAPAQVQRAPDEVELGRLAGRRLTAAQRAQSGAPRGP